MRIGPLGDQNSSLFFIETARCRHVVKIVDESYSRSDTHADVLYLERLTANGIPAVQYILSRNGDAIFEDERTMATVQRWVSGFSPHASLTSVSQIGRLLGKMSLVPARALPVKQCWVSAGSIRRGVKRLRQDFSRDRDAQRILAVYDACRAFEEKVLPRLPRSIIHTDLHSENVLFDGGRLVAVLDWDDATVSASILDFASSVAYWCFDGETVRPRMYRALYENYVKERPFNELEIVSLKDGMRYVGVAQSLWRFFQWDQGQRAGALWALGLGDAAFPTFTT